MGISKPRVDFLAGYTSWYNYAGIFQGTAYSATFGHYARQGRSEHLQIDDGYEAFVGDWHDVDRKSSRRNEEDCRQIHENGLWQALAARFLLGFKSKSCEGHPDWLLKPDGKNVTAALRRAASGSTIFPKAAAHKKVHRRV